MEPRFVFAIGGVVVACLAVGSFTAAATAVDGRPPADEAALMADAGLDQTVTVDTTVQLDGSGSTHSDGSIDEYEWSIHTPTGAELEPACPECKRTQFTPTAPGRYEVTLEVSDGTGTRSADTLYVFVGDAGPSVEVDGDRTPDPAEPVQFTATAESSGADLEEIAWSVDDEIVAIRSLDGHADESTFHFAFTETETHRVQAVVQDEHGRTAYDDIFVQPQAEDEVSSISWSGSSVSTPEPGCSDGVYFSENPDECFDGTQETTPEPTPESTPEDPVEIGEESIEYATDGFYQNQFAGALAKGSDFVGQQIESVGIDGGENAPWRQDRLEQAYDATLGAGSTFLFGQEEKTEECEITAGELNSCDETVRQLENEGRTTNVHSPDESGAYSKYGLEGAERTYGINPDKLKDGQKAEVTIITQPEKEGAVQKTARTVGGAADDLQSVVNDVVEDNGPDSDNTETDTTDTDSTSSVLDSYDGSSLSGNHHDSSKSAEDFQETNTDSSSSVDIVSDHSSQSNWITSSDVESPSDSTEAAEGDDTSSGIDSSDTGSASTVGLMA